VPTFTGDKIARETIASVMQMVIYQEMEIDVALQRASDMIEQQNMIFTMF
jgi:hypothetical protein